MADCFSLPNAVELVNFLRVDAKELSMLVNGKAECNVLWKAADVIEQLLQKAVEDDAAIALIRKKAEDEIEALLVENARLKAERDAAVADLQDCMHYAKPKNNNVCNFCKKDMAEYPDKCAGWSDFCKCEPEWRGVTDTNVGSKKED